MLIQYFYIIPLLIVWGQGVSSLGAPFDSAEAASPEAVIESIIKNARSKSVPSGPYCANIVCAEQASGKIIIFKPSDKNPSFWNNPESVVWEWHPKESPEIQPSHRSWFNCPDECKPVLGTSHLLLTASGGGVALVRLSDKSTRFYAKAGGNPHSAVLLPDGNIVSISSAGYFLVYDVPEHFSDPEKVKSVRYPSVGGHGLVWDNQQKTLWVLGYTQLVAYKYNFDKHNPAMTKDFSVSLAGTPASGGHDLYPVPNQRLLFTTGKAVAVFNLQTRQFTQISDKGGIKSVSMSPSGEVIVLSPTKSWWSESVTFLNESFSPIGTRDKAQIYKARWWIPNTMSDF